MRKTTKPGVSSLLLTLGLLLSSCGDPTPPAPPAPTPTPPNSTVPVTKATGVVEFSPKLRELSDTDRANIVRYDDNSIYVKNGSSYKVGDVITSDNSPILLRRIISVSNLDGETKLTTEPGSLEDVIVSGKISAELPVFSPTNTTATISANEKLSSQSVEWEAARKALCPRSYNKAYQRNIPALNIYNLVYTYCVALNPSFVFEYDATSKKLTQGIKGEISSDFYLRLIKQFEIKVPLHVPGLQVIRAVNSSGKALNIPVKISADFVFGPYEKSVTLYPKTEKTDSEKQADKGGEIEIPGGIWLKTTSKVSAKALYVIDPTVPSGHKFDFGANAEYSGGLSSGKGDIINSEDVSPDISARVGIDFTIKLYEVKADIFVGGKADTTLKLSEGNLSHEKTHFSVGGEASVKAEFNFAFFKVKLVDFKYDDYDSFWRSKDYCGSLFTDKFGVKLNSTPAKQIIGQDIAFYYTMKGYPFYFEPCDSLGFEWRNTLGLSYSKDISQESGKTGRNYKVVSPGQQSVTITLKGYPDITSTATVQGIDAKVSILPEATILVKDQEQVFEAQGLGVGNSFSWSLKVIRQGSLIEEDVSPLEASLVPNKTWAKVTLFNPRSIFNDQYIIRAFNTDFPTLVATATFRSGYNVSTKVQGEGFLDPSGPTAVETGKTLRIRVMPQAGNKLYYVEAPDCPGSLTTEGDATYYVTGPLTKHCVVTATFERVASTNPVVLKANTITVSPPTAVGSEQPITFTAHVVNSGSEAFSGHLAVAIKHNGVWKLVQSLSLSQSPLGSGVNGQTYTFKGDPDLPAGNYEAQLFYALVPPADVNNVTSAGWVAFPNITTPVTILPPPAVVKITAPNLVAPVGTPLALTATVTGTRRQDVTWSEPSGFVHFSNYDKSVTEVQSPVPGKYKITATSKANPARSDTVEFVVGSVTLSGSLPTAVQVKSEQEMTVTASVKNISEYDLPFGGLLAVGMDVNGDGTYWAPIGVARFNTAEHPLLAKNAEASAVFKKTIMSKAGTYKLKLFYNELQTADATSLASTGWKAIAESKAEVLPPDVAITVTPSFESAPTDGGLKTFTATITGSQDKGVTWTSDIAGVTFLPDNKANPVQVKALLPMTYTITATSNVNPTAKASAQFKVGSVVLKATDPVVTPNPLKLGDTVTVTTQLTNEVAALSSPFTGWVTAAIKWTEDRVDANGQKVPGAWQTLGVKRFGSGDLAALQQGQTVPLTFTGLAAVAAGTYPVQLFYAEQQPADEGNANSTNWKPLGKPTNINISEPIVNTTDPYLDLEFNDCANIAKDSSVNNFSGVNNGGVSCGTIAGTAKFNGVNQYLRYNNLLFANAKTILTRMRIDAPFGRSNWATIATKSIGSGYPASTTRSLYLGYVKYADGSTNYHPEIFGLSTAAQSALKTGASNVKEGTWINVVMRHNDNGTIDIFHDGVMAYTFSGYSQEQRAEDFKTYPFDVGADFVGELEYFNGQLDYLKVYNRALSDAEIATMTTPASILADIMVTCPQKELAPTATMTCTAKGVDSSGQPLPTQPTFTFQSSDPNVTSVDPNTGVVTGKVEGPATITASAVVNGQTVMSSAGSRYGFEVKKLNFNLSKISTIAVGYSHWLAIKDDGTVTAWGNNDYGQIDVPAGLDNVISIAAGSNHSLALKNDGTVVAWGNNKNGEVSVPAGLANVVSIKAGDAFSLALKDDGTVVAWGWNESGRSTIPAGLNNVIEISAGVGHSLALKSDGKVVAWGNNSFTQVDVPKNLSNVASISAGAWHSLALKSDGTVVAWGESYSPQGLVNAIKLSGGERFSLALKSDGTLTPWGLSSNFEKMPKNLSNIIDIATREYSSLALKSDGTVIAWGHDGQINVPTNLKVRVP